MAFDPNAQAPELVVPDAISTGSGQTVSNAEPYTYLDPCPTCNARPHDAPDGCHADGKPRWNFPHCWRCGHRPGVNNATPLSTLQRDFDEFRKWQSEQHALPSGAS